MDIYKHKPFILKTIFKRINKDDCIVFLFGSYAEGKQIRSSDIDIGILARNAVSPKDYIEVQEELNNNIPVLRQIDFVDFASVDKKVKKEAVKEIEIWHTGKNCHELLKTLKQA